MDNATEKTELPKYLKEVIPWEVHFWRDIWIDQYYWWYCYSWVLLTFFLWNHGTVTARGTEEKALWVRQTVVVKWITSNVCFCCTTVWSTVLPEVAKVLILKNAKYLSNVTSGFQIIMCVRQQDTNTLRNEICWSFFVFLFLKYTKEKK